MTQQDVDLARQITEIAADHKVEADPGSVSMIELGLDTAQSANRYDYVDLITVTPDPLVAQKATSLQIVEC